MSEIVFLLEEKMQNRNPYRTSDHIVMPSKVLARLVPSYQKIAGSRLIGPHLELQNRRSGSFSHFIDAVNELANKIRPDGIENSQK